LNDPSKTLDKDGGDDTQRRFHYQAAYAALEAARLMDEGLNYDSVYVEQIEDILIKLKTGKFIGIQVKSQKDENGWFTFNDKPIIGAIRRFIEHERRFQTKFKRYLLCTNCGFRNVKSASSLPHCLSVIRKHNDLDSCLKEVNFSDCLLSIKRGSDYEDSLVLNTLKKVETVTWNSLREYERLLPLDIIDVLNYRHEDLGTMEKIADKLTELASTAARLPRKGSEPSYYEWLMNPREAELDAIIQKKRITRDQVQTILDQCMIQLGALEGLSPMTISDWSTGMNILELKMCKGGITEDDIEQVKDSDNSAFKLLMGWNYKYGKLAAASMAENLRLMVKHECRDAYNICKHSSLPFGERMLTLVRERLRQRQQEVSLRYNNACVFEHLEGVAGMLTERCDVWWSEKFEVTGK
jgi:hypothetical protein